jgi:two-component system, OmpR family, phosphate regulon sensor histidine kinase PhoR
MGSGKLFWKLFFGNAVLMAVVMGSCVWLIVADVNRFYAQELTGQLKAHATMLCGMVQDRFTRDHAGELEQLVRSLDSQHTYGIRITLILADGNVLAESDADAAGMEPHANRPEVVQALAGGWGEDTRLSHTLLQDTRYVAVRVGPAQAPLGVVRTAMAIRTIGRHSETVRGLIWRIGAVGVLAGLVFALGLARLWSNPIRRITETARSLSRGDLSARAQVTGTDELATLARSLNQMRDHLAVQLETIDRQRRTLESLLAQLHEGVIVAGPDGRIVLMNPSAVRLLGLDGQGKRPEGFHALPVEQCVREHELQKMLLTDPSKTPLMRPASNTGEPAIREARLTLQNPAGPIALLARASEIVLPRPAGGQGGAGRSDGLMSGRLLVLTDITDLTRAMQVKTDFAANASHELRTPLSAIRAAVETLMGLDPAADASAVGRFLEMIDKHSKRMEAMVADLLDLSRIESSPDQFRPEPVSLRKLLDTVQTQHEAAVTAGGLEWRVDRPPSLDTITANAHLLQLVLDNLVDNAVKFTGSGGYVRVSCREDVAEATGHKTVTIEVADNGCGIPEAEQNRVFERFYQVGRARSGVVRGTGLGLSIVRHAVAAMQGTVTLRSKLGEGTCVTIAIAQPGQ